MGSFSGLNISLFLNWKTVNFLWGKILSSKDDESSPLFLDCDWLSLGIVMQQSSLLSYLGDKAVSRSIIQAKEKSSFSNKECIFGPYNLMRI